MKYVAVFALFLMILTNQDNVNRLRSQVIQLQSRVNQLQFDLEELQ